MSHALILFALTLTGADAPPALSPTPAPVESCPAAVVKAPSPEVWNMTLRNALRIGIDNSESVRLIELRACGVGGAPPLRASECEDPAPATQQIVIAPVQPDPSAAGRWRWKAETMALVRSIEQQYWNLAQQQARRDAAEKAVRLTEEILKRERDELECCVRVADLAEIQQRLEQFRLDLVTATSDLITTEKQLRHLLGLPPADNRTIVPVTAPTEAPVEPNWKACCAEMLENQPDLAQQRAVVEVAKKRLTEAEAKVALTVRLGIAHEPPSGEFRQARETFRKEDTFLAQIVQQTTHSLARFFLELDANYKQFQTAKRFRAAAAQRLEAQRACYEQGRITIDRYLDAVIQYTSAVAQEAQFKASYNISLIALEEAKGTLLGHDQIVVADPPRPRAEPKRDDSAKVASYEGTPGKTPEPPRASEAGKTVSFQFTVGAGPKPLEIRGSFTVTPAPPGR
jgi:hypothetical protein